MGEVATSLYKYLGYLFSDHTLLLRAVTHRSANSDHNERLEYLGDSILSFLVAEALFQQFPEAREGELTRLRAVLVRKESLAVFARRIDLGGHLQLGSGELKSGGRERDSILADAFEALIGAIYLEAGIETCRSCVLGIIGPKLIELAGSAAEKDPKTRLQEHLQALGMALPAYSVSDVAGDAHEHSFTVQCRVDGLDHPALGQGGNRRAAEQDAARSALAMLASVTGSRS